MEKLTLHNQDCIKVLQSLSSKSIDLIITDPPYFRVKSNDWDNQWPSESAFFEWLETVIVQCARVLKNTGSIYLFAGHKLATKTEALMTNHFNIENHIVWVKTSGMFKRQCRGNLRRYFGQTERIIFATAKCTNEKVAIDRAYADACQPIIDYFNSCLRQSNLTQSKVNKLLGTHMTAHWFGRSQWRLPNLDYYKRLQIIMPCLNKPHDELVIWRDQLLKSKQHTSRRVFNVADTQWFTDVWVCQPVQYYEGKHPCEKPQQIMEQIIKASSNKGDLVLDPFVGGGATGIAALNNGRRFIGSELDKAYFTHSKARLEVL